MYDEIFPDGLPLSPIQLIKNSNLPVYLYGMGNGAEKMLAVCVQYGIEVAGVFASNGFRAGKIFLGYTVLSLSEVAEMHSEGFIALVCFGCKSSDMRSYLGKVKKAGGTVYMPHLPLFGGELFTAENYEANADKILRAYSLLSDDGSRRLFRDILTYCLTWDPEALFLGETNSYVYPEFFRGLNIETAIDGGAYRGDTVMSMSRDLPGIKRIYAFEPDQANYSKLKDVIVPQVEVIPIQKGLYDKECDLYFVALKNRGSHFGNDGIKVEVTSVDCAVREKIGLIKLDVEGCEEKAIIGCEKTIRRDKPCLYISLYHKTNDIFDLILQLHKLCPEYKFSMFRADVCPAWDIILIAK